MTFFRLPSLILLFAVAIFGTLAPALARAEDKKPVKVFILAGQSNSGTSLATTATSRCC